MTVFDVLWDAYSDATVSLLKQQEQVFEVLQKMANAILDEQITDTDEIDEILLEIYAFSDHYSPALALFKEMRRHIREKNPVFWRMESAIVRAIFEVNADRDDEGNL